VHLKLLCSVFLAACMMAADPPRGSVRGTVIDVMGAAIGRASVRLADPATQTVHHQVATSDAGTLLFEGVAAGDYLLSMVAPGFRERVEAVRVEDGRVLNAGRVQLSLLPCGSPGVNCEQLLDPFPAASAPAGEVRGTVTDDVGSVLYRAEVRLLSVRTQEIRYRTTVNADSRFQFDGVTPGDYFVSVLGTGFMEAVEAIRVAEDKVLDVGHVRLHPPPCWYPGVNCEGAGGPRPTAPVYTVCEALAALQSSGAAPFPSVVVGRLVRTERGSFLEGTCANRLVTDGRPWPNIIPLVRLGSLSQTQPAAAERWDRQGAPSVSVSGWLRMRDPRLAVPCPDGPACTAWVSPVSAAAILLYEGPNSIQIIEPRK
jgi:hypothetical protein